MLSWKFRRYPPSLSLKNYPDHSRLSQLSYIALGITLGGTGAAAGVSSTSCTRI
jgi:hypothetical protein